MATYVNVTVGGGELLDRDRQQRQASRFDALEKQKNEELQAEKDKQSEEKQGKALKPLPYKREPAAHRAPATVFPLAICWKGLLTTGADPAQIYKTVIWEGTFVGNPNVYQDTLFTSYSGGDQLAPHPIRFATDRGQVAVIEGPRMGGFSTTIMAYRALFPDGSYYSKHQNNYPGKWVEQARRFVDEPWRDIAPSPVQLYPHGPTGYMPTVSMLSVSPNGTVFLVFDLPAEPVDLTEYNYQDYINAGYPTNSLVHQAPTDIIYSTSLGGGAFKGRYAFIRTESGDGQQRLLFMRISGAQIQHKIVIKPKNVVLKDFYAGAAYADDPSTAVRSLGYTGEYRVEGTRAKLLWFGKPQAYRKFPFGYLTQYRTTSDGLPQINDSSVFVEHVYQLNPWSTPAGLKTQLEALRAKGEGGTQPIQTQDIRPTAGMFSPAAQNLGNDGDGYVTPNLFMAIKR